jgi:hypothetical protein
VLEDCAKSTIEAMRRSGMRRLLVVSAALLFPDLGLAAALLRLILHNPMIDSKAMEEVVSRF